MTQAYELQRSDWNEDHTVRVWVSICTGTDFDSLKAVCAGWNAVVNVPFTGAYGETFQIIEVGRGTDMKRAMIVTGFYAMAGNRAYTAEERAQYESQYGHEDAFDRWQFDVYRQLAKSFKGLGLSPGMKVGVEVLDGKKPLIYRGMIDKVSYGPETYQKHQVYSAKPFMRLQQAKAVKLIYADAIGKVIYE